MAICTRLGLVVYFVFLICITASATEFNAKTIELTQCNFNLTKLNGNLLSMRLAILHGESNLSVFSQWAPYALRNGKLQCLMGVTDISPALIESCTKANLILVGAYSHGYLHQVVVQCSDPCQFDEIVERSDVIGITPEPYALSSAGIVENEALNSLGVDRVVQSYGYEGRGVRIGILSDSLADQSRSGRVVDQYFMDSDAQKKGEMPEKIRVLDEGDGTGEDEGSAMIELIHDLVPESDISFAAVKYSYSAFPDNIKKLWNDPGFECNILVDDISFPAEPLYQLGPIAQAAMDAVAHGVTYVAAAGNSGDNAHEKPFTDVSPERDTSYPPSGNDFHDFGLASGYSSDTHLTFYMPLYSTILLALHWDEPYGGVLGEGPGASSDLDLYLVSDESTPLHYGTDGNILASSMDIQGNERYPMGEPIEFLVYTNQVRDRYVHVVVNHADGRQPQMMHLFVLFDKDSNKTNIDQSYLRSRTILGHMVTPQVLTVAAIPYQEIDRNGNYLDPVDVWRVQPFSALGGWLPVYFSEDGYSLLSPPLSVFKPDFTAPDNTSTSVRGFETFTGTSAAAANLSAIAALVTDASHPITTAQLNDVLSQSTIDIERPGVDSYSGKGLVNAWQAIQILYPSAVRYWNLVND